MKELIGKTITDVKKATVDLYGEEDYVCELVKITCSDGDEIIYATDAGDISGAYACVNIVDLNDPHMVGKTVPHWNASDDAKWIENWN